jgi:hypothetical protein
MTEVAIDEVTEAQIWIQARLLGSSAVVAAFPNYIGVHPAPRALATYPILTIEPQITTPDTHVIGAGILWANVSFLVRGIVDGDDPLPLQAGVVAIHAALHQQYSTTANAQIWCWRHKPFYMYELSDTLSFLHKGGIYLCQVRPL